MVACGPVRIVRTVLLICAAGCASRRSGAPAGAAPAGAPPAPHESLHVTVTYPAATDVIQAHDSSFLFGTVRGGAGPAGLSVNGTPVPVLPSGAWIAWVPLPDDTIASFRLVGRAGADSVVTVFAARVALRFHPPEGRTAWIDTTSFAPTGTLTLPAGEGIRLTARAAPGAASLAGAGIRPPLPASHVHGCHHGSAGRVGDDEAPRFAWKAGLRLGNGALARSPGSCRWP